MSQQYDWAALIRAVQRKLRMSQYDFGDRLKVTPVTVSHILNGKRNPGHSLKRELLELATANGMAICKYESHSIADAITRYIEKK